LPQAQRVGNAGVCEVTLPSQDGVSQRQDVLDAIRQCVADPGAGPAIGRQIAAAKEEEQQVRTALGSYAFAANALAIATAKLTAVRTDLAAARELGESQGKARDAFSEIEFMADKWYLLGPLLVPLPPAILQILLTFLSGLFGALLVTLVLIVYPKKDIPLKATGHTWARTFLGGLIALCVYIVLLSGTAVLGSSTASAGAGTNYMAFCGIGILAGMFSDRVAQWLSTRADIFFRQSEPEKDG
jgi:hypothetical protein